MSVSNVGKCSHTGAICMSEQDLLENLSSSWKVIQDRSGSFILQWYRAKVLEYGNGSNGWINNIYSFSWFFSFYYSNTFWLCENLLILWRDDRSHIPVVKWVGVTPMECTALHYGVHSTRLWSAQHRTALDVCFSCNIHYSANSSGSVKEYRFCEHYCNALLFHCEFSFLNMEVGLSLSSSLLYFGIGPLC